MRLAVVWCTRERCCPQPRPAPEVGRAFLAPSLPGPDKAQSRNTRRSWQLIYNSDWTVLFYRSVPSSTSTRRAGWWRRASRCAATATAAWAGGGAVSAPPPAPPPAPPTTPTPAPPTAPATPGTAAAELRTTPGGSFQYGIVSS